MDHATCKVIIVTVTSGTSAQQISETILGKTVDGARVLGGLLEIQAQDMQIVVGDGVNVRYYSQEQQVPPRHQLHVEFDDFSSLVCTVQMYGGLWAFRVGENDNPYYLVAQAKPDPLSDAFDRTYFDALCTPADEKLSIKAFLATKQRIPGLGNGVLQDILFHAGLHPKSKMNALTNTDFDALYLAIKGTFASMTAGGGRDTEKDTIGTRHFGYRHDFLRNWREVKEKVQESWVTPIAAQIGYF